MLLLAGVRQIAAAVDPLFNYVTLLLPGNGTNGAQNNTFLDSSTNNFTITRNGNTTQGTFSPFSQTGWSNHFDGSGDYLDFATSSAFTMGSGDFTIECWYYPLTSYASYNGYIFDLGNNGTRVQLYYNQLYFIPVAGSAVTGSAGVGIPPYTWYHLACVRSGSTITVYLNGTSIGTVSNSSNLTDNDCRIGDYGGGFVPFNGYISNFRIVKGTAVYTEAFTPPTAPLTAITNTSLLTCQSNRFVDNSSNAFAITVNGNTSIQAFSPFNPTAAWDAATNGGSGYFDGSGDYLSFPDNSAFDIGLSNDPFTIELWYYPLSLSDTTLFGRGGGAGAWNSTNGWQYSLFPYSSSTLFYFQYWSGSGLVNMNGSTPASYGTGRWNHIAVSYDGTNTAIFINGTRIATNTTGYGKPTASNITHIGKSVVPAETAYANGYISGARIVKGTAVYNPTLTTLTVPTAPLTAITNTSLLCNFTNAGIGDYTAKNDLETVGNSQTSTAQYKWGDSSMYFDGNGDNLSVRDNELIQLASGDFTIECWVYPTANGALYDSGIVSYGAPSTLAGWFFGMSGTNIGGTLNRLIWGVNYGSGGGAPVYGNAGLSLNTWSHVAVSKSGTTISLFINGNLDKTATVTATPTTSSSYKLYLGAASYDPTGTQRSLTGYIQDARITKGYARYLYNFIPPDAAFPLIGGTVTLTADPYYEYTTLLLPGNGTNGAQNNTFLDSSTNNFTITRNGNTTQGTFSPFSQTGWGNYFDGSGDYLSLADNAAFDVGSGDFTFEFWMYTSVTGSTMYIFGQSNSMGSTATVPYVISKTSSNKLMLTITNGVGVYNATSTNDLPVNQWVHIACVRDGNTLRNYINGTQDGTADVTGVTAPNSSNQLAIGRLGEYNVSLYSGYISNFRMVVGTCVYTGGTAFTPPTAPLTAITNTSLLTCQSNRFIDNSSNAFAITRNGDVSVQAFSPFNPTTSYNAAANGGSGYFDGSGDYLTVASGTSTQWGTGDYYIEAWYYPINPSANVDTIVATTTLDGASNPSVNINIDPADYKVRLGVSYATSNTVTKNAWNWIVVSRVSGTVRIWINGVLGSTNADSTNLNNNSNMYIGNRLAAGSNYTIGQCYLANIKLLGGSGVTSVTMPTTPPTGGNILVNFTNAGIYDATSKNDFETVGNTQISTTQSKFGGSSMYFDGSGDYLLGPWNPPTDLGAGDFTIEFWMYPTAVGQSSVSYLFNLATNASFGPILIAQSAGGYGIVLYSSSTGSSWNLASGSSFGTATANDWNHVALTRYGADVRLFLNGVLGTTLNWSTTALLTGSTYRPNIGSGGGVANTFYTGYMQDLRVTKGIARYTRNFTPPTTAFLTL